MKPGFTSLLWLTLRQQTRYNEHEKILTNPEYEKYCDTPEWRPVEKTELEAWDIAQGSKSGIFMQENDEQTYPMDQASIL